MRKNIEQLEKSNKRMFEMIRDGWIKHYTESKGIPYSDYMG